MKKKLMALMLIPVVLLMFSSCKSGSSSEATASPATDGDSMVFTDSAGRQVEIPKNITRIVASGYPAQLVLFALAPDKLVGLAESWSDLALESMDPKYHDLSVLGSFYGSGDLNLEEIAVQDPQIIIDVGEPKSSIVEDMNSITEQVGIPTVHIEAGLDSMPEAYRMLGKLLGMEEEAEELAAYCENVLSKTQNLAEQLGADGMKSLLYCMGSDGLNVIAQGTYHAQVIDRLSNNPAVIENASSKGTGNPVDMEQLLNWDPEVIIFAPDSIYDTVREDETWRQLQAISGGNFYEIPAGPYNWMSFPPSVNRYLGMIWLAGILYPETETFNVYEEATRFFELFYHTTLTEEQFNELTKNSLT